MKLYVKEYCWMWSDLHLSLAECRVYAYIYGLTHGDKGGYNGSKRHLAELLGLPQRTALDAMNRLTDKHLIVCTDGIWRSEQTPLTSEQLPLKDERQPLSPHTPLYNNIYNKKQADMQTSIFEKFFKKFAPEFKNRYAVTSYNFDRRSDAAQKAMWDAVKDEPDGSVNKNPFFFVQDFPDPQPVFLRGDESGDIVQVRYNGAYKLCYRATMELFGLEFVRDW